MDEDFTLDELKLAFTFHITNQILESDGTVAPEELAFLQKWFPEAVFRESRFIDAKGRYTSRWEDALGEALLQLPERLSVEERLDLLETFYRAAISDGDTQYIEGNILVRAARLLGLKPSQFTARVEAMFGTGSIDLPLPE
ncbi:MAG: TerB family tellurite resistance protein [Alphaproteobacteria bacterium]|nr:TerB family tellurite resistance protein [Alphaproteobacteria bacterium]MCB9690349.1 TerB family tellurite resistance protein [Alphaproteobacteria bacterium]